MAKSLVEFAQDLKREVPIDQLIGEYVPLRRAGKSFKGRCPFHEEKTPSFHVSPDRGNYHCFGCGASGDVIKFVQEIEKLDFRLAVERVARRFNVAIPEFSGSQTPEERDRAGEHRRMLLAICRHAEEFFVEQLWNSPAGSKAREYLTGRGLTPDQIRYYRLGFAPPGYETFLALARKHGYRDEMTAEAGLASQRESGGFVDRFRNRIIFPIADLQGEIVAFGGRLMEGDGPKYLNSADTPLFHKGKLLYGLDAAREAIREADRHAILLEGYMDWIALHSHGIGHAVAGLGTAFGRDQARLLRRMAGTVTLLYDGDEAGRKARFRNAEHLIAEGIAIRVAEMPEGEDPDSYLRARGTAALRQVIESARGGLDYFIQEALTRFPVSTPEGKAESVQFLAPLLRAIPEPIVLEDYVRLFASQLGVRTETVLASLKRTAPRNTPTEEQSGESARLEISFDRLECALLHRLVTRVDRWEVIQGIELDLFEDYNAKSIFTVIYEKSKGIREGEEVPSDWLAECKSEQQRAAMSHILYFDALQAGGSVDASRLSLSQEEIDGEIREIASRLRRKRGQRLRMAAKHEAQRERGGFEDHLPRLSAIQTYSSLILQESQILLGEGSTETTSPGGK